MLFYVMILWSIIVYNNNYAIQFAIIAIQHKTEYNKIYNEHQGFNYTASDYMRLDPINTNKNEYHNNKKSSLKYNWQTQEQRHQCLIINWCLDIKNRKVFQEINW